MSANYILSILENVAKTIERQDDREQSIKNNFDKVVGIRRGLHDEVVSLLKSFSDTKAALVYFKEEITKCGEEIKETDDKIEKYKKKLSQTTNATEKAELQNKIKEGEQHKQELQDRKASLIKNQNSKNDAIALIKIGLANNGIPKGNIDKALKAVKNMTNNLLGLTDDGGGMDTKFSKLAKNPYFQAVGLLVDAVEFGIDKSTQYLRLNTENTLRLISATSTGTLNKMKVGLDAWEDAVNSAYSAQELTIDSQLAMIEAQNATAMANLKMANTWTNWIPIWKEINEYGEAKLEQEQKLQEAWMKNAKEQLSMLNQYAKRIDAYNKSQDKSIHAYQAERGFSTDQTKAFGDRMFKLAPEFAKYNKTIEDALKMQSNYAEISGRTVNFSDKEYNNNFAVGRLVGEDNLMNFEAQMNIFNQSVSDSADIMYDMYKDANRMGISQKKLVKDVLGNLSLANKYDFKNGTKGFIELAKWAESARFNLSSLGSALEKIQSGGLENTITTAAKLQVLGGSFAMLSNPLSMEFEANADPEAYAKHIQKMFSTMGNFNNETGQTTFAVPENKMIRAAAEALGISVEDAKNMARGARQKDFVKRQMAYSSLKPEDQDAIANMAQFDKEKKQWYVNTIDGKRKNVGDVTEWDLDKILSGNKEEDSEKYAQSTLSVAEQIEATTKQINAQLGLLTFDKFKEMSKEEMKIISGEYSKYQSNIEELYAQIKNDNNKDLEKTTEESLSSLLTARSKNRTITETNGSKMDYDEGIDAAYKFIDGDKSDNIVDILKRSPKAREYLNEKQIKEVYGIDTRGWYKKYVTDMLVAHGNAIYADYHKNDEWVDSEKDPQSIKDDISLYRKRKVDDGVISSNGSPIMVSASNVTPIQDGSVKLAKSDPKDSAIFAKTGGPFDKLFDDIFGKVDSIYNMAVRQHYFENKQYLSYCNVQKQFQETHQAVRYDSDSTTNNRYGGDTVKYDTSRIHTATNSIPLSNIAPNNQNEPSKLNSNQPLNVHIYGELNLKSPTGETINLTQMIQNDPMLVRRITELIVSQIGNNTHGGRNEMFRNRYSST